MLRVIHTFGRPVPGTVRARCSHIKVSTMGNNKTFFFVLQIQIRRRVKDWRIKVYFLEENIPNMLGPRFFELSTSLLRLEYSKFLHVSSKWSLTLVWLRLRLSSATQLNIQQGHLSPTSMRCPRNTDWFRVIYCCGYQCDIMCTTEA
jgi:hypothetical protein